MHIQPSVRIYVYFFLNSSLALHIQMGSSHMQTTKRSFFCMKSTKTASYNLKDSFMLIFVGMTCLQNMHIRHAHGEYAYFKNKVLFKMHFSQYRTGGTTIYKQKLQEIADEECRRREDLLAELMTLPEGEIYCFSTHGRRNYYQRLSASGNRKRKG